MSLCYREQRQLRGIEADLFRSDSHLAGMLEMFGRLYSGQDIPASEQVPSGRPQPASRHPDRGGIRRRRPRYQHPVQRGAHPASPVRRARIRPPADQPECSPPSRQADGQQNPPGQDRQPPMTMKGVSDAGHSPPGGIGARLGAGRARAPLQVGGLPAPRLAAELSRAEGITIKMVIRGTSAGFADGQ